MGMEYSPRRKKNLNKKRKREEKAGFGGKVTIRKIGEDYERPPTPRQRRENFGKAITKYGSSANKEPSAPAEPPEKDIRARAKFNSSALCPGCSEGITVGQAIVRISLNGQKAVWWHRWCRAEALEALRKERDG